MKSANSFRHLSLFVCGDIMTGRGIDQILPHSAPPRLFEPHVQDARDYLALAQQRSGAIPSRVDFSYVWGAALEEFSRYRPQVRIVNLETSLTAGGEPWPEKMVHYRMHPENAPLLTTAGIDVAVLANNHVLAWGYAGFKTTLDTLRKIGVQTAGAGSDLAAARAPAVVEGPGGGRVLVFAFGLASSGIPAAWAAGRERAGVNLLPGLSAQVADRIGTQVKAAKRPGDLVMASLHWGGNWDYAISAEQRRFAQRLLDRAGIDLVHGHSSHHVKGFEVYRGKLILYGCGDLITDYEGISGYERFRGDLGLMYFLGLDPSDGRLVELNLVPMQMRRFRLVRANRQDTAWLCDVLNREGEPLGTRLERREDDTLALCRP